jgi:hypothetical protein
MIWPKIPPGRYSYCIDRLGVFYVFLIGIFGGGAIALGVEKFMYQQGCF